MDVTRTEKTSLPCNPKLSSYSLSQIRLMRTSFLKCTWEPPFVNLESWYFVKVGILPSHQGQNKGEKTSTVTIDYLLANLWCVNTLHQLWVSQSKGLVRGLFWRENGASQIQLRDSVSCQKPLVSSQSQEYQRDQRRKQKQQRGGWEWALPRTAPLGAPSPSLCFLPPSSASLHPHGFREGQLEMRNVLNSREKILSTTLWWHS